jgi:hypothetical protein
VYAVTWGPEKVGLFADLVRNTFFFWRQFFHCCINIFGSGLRLTGTRKYTYAFEAVPTVQYMRSLVLAVIGRDHAGDMFKGRITLSWNMKKQVTCTYTALS